MNEIAPTHRWPLLQKIVFRFFFIYLGLYMAPWAWFNEISVLDILAKPFLLLTDWAVNLGNRYIFHVKPVLVPIGGSGDTSYGWAQMYLYLLLAATGTLAWTLLGRRTAHHTRLFYWFRTAVRYYLSLFLFLYGIIKMFAMQMTFPTPSQLATPLGDFLPMRFSWVFIGYSTPYQVFLGAVEVLAALLLLYRGTVTAGLLASVGVFSNVLLMNLCYDVPVKLFSAHLFFCSLFLLAVDGRRLYSFFVLNRTTPGCDLYRFDFQQKWLRIGRIVAKILFIIASVGWGTFDVYTYWSTSQKTPDPRPFAGQYDVERLVVNRDTVPLLSTDSVRWHNLIFEKGNFGSIGTTDTLFRQRYRRGYFSFEADTVQRTLVLKKRSTDSIAICTLHYTPLENGRVAFRTVFRNDSMYLECVKSRRHYQLAERQFHWLSEANR